ncbi:TIR domain-containing protein [Janibacter melonis]|uniref:TIR domain-containing protein n=1 Tax=Janibacter melonis TaxID=262209 RepID=UPI003556AC7E
MDRIRTKYLGDSSVTIVLVGSCTWARRYVDWEVYSSLRRASRVRSTDFSLFPFEAFQGAVRVSRTA